MANFYVTVRHETSFQIVDPIILLCIQAYIIGWQFYVVSDIVTGYNNKFCITWYDGCSSFYDITYRNADKRYVSLIHFHNYSERTDRSAHDLAFLVYSTLGMILNAHTKTELTNHSVNLSKFCVQRGDIHLRPQALHLLDALIISFALLSPIALAGL